MPLYCNRKAYIKRYGRVDKDSLSEAKIEQLNAELSDEEEETGMGEMMMIEENEEKDSQADQ